MMSVFARRAHDAAGFTLLEIMLSIAAIAAIAAIGIPVSRSFQPRNDLDIAAVAAAQTLRRAQAAAQGMDGDASWGVYVYGGTITLFQGARYAGRDADFDEIIAIPQSIAASGAQEIVFVKFSGEPQGGAGAVTFTSLDNESKTIAVNAKGTVSY